jgi:hypothetical protein
VVGGVTTATFKRALIGNEATKDQSISDQPYTVSWATDATSKTSTYHTDRGMCRIRMHQRAAVTTTAMTVATPFVLVVVSVVVLSVC